MATGDVLETHALYKTFESEGAPVRALRGVDFAMKPGAPAKPGVHVFADWDLTDLRDYIDWTPFFRAWELAGNFPAILTDEVVGESATSLYADAQAIAHTLTEQYIDGAFDRVILVYNHFDSPLVQKVTEQEVLPIPEHLLETDEEERRDDAMRGDFIFEPEPEEILERLLPVYLETQVYRALLESAASEQGARMTAMRNASKNAGELIDSLTLQMNRARQAEITQEILEVVAGADALTQ